MTEKSTGYFPPDDGTRFLCDPCLKEKYANLPRKNQLCARCHGCDDIVLCSEFHEDKLEPNTKSLWEGMPWAIDE